MILPILLFISDQDYRKAICEDFTIFPGKCVILFLFETFRKVMNFTRNSLNDSQLQIQVMYERILEIVLFSSYKGFV